MKQPLGIGLIPMTSADDVEVNLQNLLSKLSFFENKKTDLIVFPENSLFFNFHTNLRKEDALTLDHPAFKKLSAWATKHNTYLHTGGIPMLADDGKAYNTAVLITPSGELKSVYRKIHLFDVDVGGTVYKESSSVASGPTPEVIEINGWKIGLTICYDIRFAELFVHYHRQQVDLILVPAAFTVPTGRAHWATLLKARAIETQAFIVAPAQGGVHKSTTLPEAKEKQTWGESLVIAPWGDILERSHSFDALARAEQKDTSFDSPLWSQLDPTLIQQARQAIPLLNHRKLRF